MTPRQPYLMFLVAGVAGALAPALVSAVPNEGICRTQIEADVEKRFQQTITRIYRVSGGGC